MRRRPIVVLVLALACAWPAFAADPLPSWNDGQARNAILSFVARVTKEGGPEFVPPAERIAVFDNDGTLWSEQPITSRRSSSSTASRRSRHSIPNGRTRSRSPRSSRVTSSPRWQEGSAPCSRWPWPPTRADHRQHEAGLETRLSRASGEPVASDDGTPARRLTQPPPTLRGVTHALEALRVGRRPLPGLIAGRLGRTLLDWRLGRRIGGRLRRRRVGLGLGARSLRESLVFIETAVLGTCGPTRSGRRRCARGYEPWWQS